MYKFDKNSFRADEKGTSNLVTLNMKTELHFKSSGEWSNLGQLKKGQKIFCSKNSLNSFHILRTNPKT